MRLLLKYQRPAIMWAFCILILCSISFGEVGKSHFFFPGFDKLVHCGLFFVFTAFAASGTLRQYGTRRFTLATGIKVFLAAFLYGAFIEILQLYVFTWRSGEWNDLFADSVGAGMATFSVLVTLYASTNAKD